MKKCLYCGKELLLNKRQIKDNVSVCGIICRNKYYTNKGKNHWNYKSGISLYRNYLKKVECLYCGIKNNLLIHHKNEDREDNDIKNLEVVCKSCHQNIHCHRDNNTGKYISIKNQKINN